MATRSVKRYDHPNVIVRRETMVAGAAGTGTKNRFFHYQKLRLKAAHLKVRTAGTAAGFTVAPTVGTTAIGTATVGTNTAGYTATVLATSPGQEGAAQDDVFCTIAGDNTGVVDVVYEYEVLPDAALTD